MTKQLERLVADTTIMNRMSRNTVNIDRNEKGKDVVSLEHKEILVQPLPRLVLDHRCDVFRVERGDTLHLPVHSGG
jgi:hypothetical protein